MAKEIECKFLVTGEEWREKSKGIFYRQGYLSTDVSSSVRIRTVAEKGYLTIKGKTHGAVREEFEYEIPVEDANRLLDNFCKKPLIVKRRYKINFGGLIWEVDEFEGENTGLTIAEVELENENEKIELPDWIGKEVTGDPKYYNVNLVRNPFSKW
jgi:CYTH domain-containing protein